MEFRIRKQTVKLISKFIRMMSDVDQITIPEEKEIIAQLKHLSEKGTLMPKIMPKLIDQKEVASMLGIGHSNFKKLESEGAFFFKRRMVGSAVRYRNTDIIKYIERSDDEE